VMTAEELAEQAGRLAAVPAQGGPDVDKQWSRP
jgi:hypothetical protein